MAPRVAMPQAGTPADRGGACDPGGHRAGSWFLAFPVPDPPAAGVPKPAGGHPRPRGAFASRDHGTDRSRPGIKSVGRKEANPEMRGPQTAQWWLPVEATEQHEDLRRRHRSDGVVTPEEDAAEARHLREIVLGTACDVAENLQLAQTIARVGLESDHVARQLRHRVRRRGAPAWLAALARLVGAGRQAEPVEPVALPADLPPAA